MPQAGFDPRAQSDTSYEADALPPSHHGWILIIFINFIYFQLWRNQQGIPRGLQPRNNSSNQRAIHWHRLARKYSEKTFCLVLTIDIYGSDHSICGQKDMKQALILP